MCRPSKDIAELLYTHRRRNPRIDLDSHPDVKKQVAGLVEGMSSEYNSYIKFSIEINPYELKVIKTLRDSKQFWIDWREENLA